MTSNKTLLSHLSAVQTACSCSRDSAPSGLTARRFPRCGPTRSLRRHPSTCLPRCIRLQTRTSRSHSCSSARPSSMQPFRRSTRGTSCATSSPPCALHRLSTAHHLPRRSPHSHCRRLERLDRHPTLEAFYRGEFMTLIRKLYGTSEAYLRKQLGWPRPDPREEGRKAYWEKEDVTVVRRNDLPYGVPKDVMYAHFPLIPPAGLALLTTWRFRAVTMLSGSISRCFTRTCARPPPRPSRPLSPRAAGPRLPRALRTPTRSHSRRARPHSRQSLRVEAQEPRAGGSESRRQRGRGTTFRRMGSGA